MVIRFTSNVTDPPVMLYMGIDKFENENLIRQGFIEIILLFGSLMQITCFFCLQYEM